MTRIHKQEADKVTKVKESNEGKLRLLESIEAKKIADLTRTIAAQKKAMMHLNEKSPAIGRTIQPRKAYKFKGQEYGSKGKSDSAMLLDRELNISQ